MRARAAGLPGAGWGVGGRPGRVRAAQASSKRHRHIQLFCHNDKFSSHVWPFRLGVGKLSVRAEIVNILGFAGRVSLSGLVSAAAELWKQPWGRCPR